MKIIKPPHFSLDIAAIQDILQKGAIPSPVTPKGRYAHWEKVRHLSPPDGLTAEKYWKQIKIARMLRQRSLPFTDNQENHFWYCQFDELLDSQHWLDKHAAGMLGFEHPDAFSAERRERFLMKGLQDEAIYSSQLEGAATTRAIARKILSKSNPRPSDHSERMIVNNYHAMEFIDRHKQEELSVNMLLELHSILTQNTLENKSDEGNFRHSDDIVVADNRDGSVMHSPPLAKQLPKRMKLLCDFANEKTGTDFLHPALRAIILHFMLAFDHPFADGNGRTARALFYWAMAHHDYWLMPYISISEIIKQAPRRYGRAFMHSETDGGDITYFLLHQMAVIRKGFARLDSHMKEQSGILRKMGKWEHAALQSGKLNRRQADLLNYAVKHPGHVFSVTEHQARHHVSYPTAHADLQMLVKEDLLIRRKAGREYIYEPAADLLSRLKVEK